MATTKKITNTEELKAAINELDRTIKSQEADLKLNYSQVKENLNPKRVAKNTFSYLAETPEIQRTLVNTIFGFIIGYASKKAVQLLSSESLDRTVETFVIKEVTRLENKNPDSLLSKGITLFRKHTPPTSPIYPFVKY